MSMLDALNRWISSIHGAIGRERSIRLTKQGVTTGRWLFTLPIGLLGPNVAERLFPLVEAWGLPPTIWEDFARDIPQYAFIHLGLEPDEVVKIYGEYRDGELKHRAYKWSPTFAPIETRYRTITPADTSVYVHQHLTGFAWEAINNLLYAIDCRPNRQKPMLLEVTETATGRQSFDLNIYSAGITLAEFEPILLRIARVFKFAEDTLTEIRTQIGTQQIGHIAAGTHRDGQLFFTIYYGAEELTITPR